MKKGGISPLFLGQREEPLQAIFETLHQTFYEVFLYPSCTERDAPLHFVMKGHLFVDGKKRRESFLFLLSLQSQSFF